MVFVGAGQGGPEGGQGGGQQGGHAVEGEHRGPCSRHWRGRHLLPAMLPGKYLTLMEACKLKESNSTIRSLLSMHNGQLYRDYCEGVLKQSIAC